MKNKRQVNEGLRSINKNFAKERELEANLKIEIAKEIQGLNNKNTKKAKK